LQRNHYDKTANTYLPLKFSAMKVVRTRFKQTIYLAPALRSRGNACYNHTQHPGKVMIWSAFGYHFKPKLVFIDGMLNGESHFEETICGHGFPFPR